MPSKITNILKNESKRVVNITRAKSTRTLIFSIDIANKKNLMAMSLCDVHSDHLHLLYMESLGGKRTFAFMADTIAERYIKFGEDYNTNNIIVLYDATGMGASMGEYLHARGIPAEGIWLHGTPGSQGRGQNGEYTVSRFDVISIEEDVVLSGQLKLTDDPLYRSEINAWYHEFKGLRRKSTTQSSNRTLNSAVIGKHGDDRILGLGQSCWWWRSFLYTGGKNYAPMGDNVRGQEARGIEKVAGRFI